MYRRNGLGDITSALNAAIQKVEGVYPPGTPGYPNGSLAWQNNNPGNIRYVANGYNYPGCVPGAGGFCKYPDIATGSAALDHQIGVQVSAGQNLNQFFNQYAPGNENNTAAYIASVSQQTGIDPSVPLNSVSGDGSISTPDLGSDSSWASLFSPITSDPSAPTYDLAGMVLTQNELIGIGAAIGLSLLVFSIL